MKIAWFTPFRKVSAIGRFSRLVTDQLAQYAQVDLWLAEAENEELHRTSLRIVRYLELSCPESFLREYDVIAYNLGDHMLNHRTIFEMSRRVPGVIILHDYVMHHFFAGYYSQRAEWDAYVEVMRRWYSADLRKMPNGGWAGDSWQVWEREEVIHYPLFEEAVVGSIAVVTHADFVRDSVARVAGAPVTKIPLAYEARSPGLILSREELQIPDDRVLVVSIGHLNENKRIQVVLQVLAANPDLARSVMYVGIGSCDGPFAPKLQELRRKLGLGDAVRFTEYAPDEVLSSYLFHADFCVNMRWPAMEGGSASIAEEMLCGKAVIVTDTGVYSELPETCVRKVRPEHETEDLTLHLRELATEGDLRRRMGEQARRYAEALYNPAFYAERFLEFCSEVPYYQPALRLMDTAGRELRRIGVTSEMPIVDAVARESELLMDGDYDPPILRRRE